MSHWDFSEWTHPCICGAGELTIRCQTENYPPFGVETDVVVNCEHCNATYYVCKRGFSPIEYPRHSDIAARMAAAAARREAWDTDPSVIDAQRWLRQKLDAMPSLAARWRWLRDHQLYTPGLAVFRRDYQADPVRLIASTVPKSRRCVFPALDAASTQWETFVFPNVPVFVMQGLAQ